jgi:hypothetical protein
MPEITIRRVGGHLRKLIEILLHSPDGLAAKAAREKLATSVQMTDTKRVCIQVLEPADLRQLFDLERSISSRLVGSSRTKAYGLLRPWCRSYNKFADPEKFIAKQYACMSCGEKHKVAKGVDLTAASAARRLPPSLMSPHSQATFAGVALAMKPDISFAGLGRLNR